MLRLLVVISVLLSSAVLCAQEHPKYDLFAGYSYLRGEGPTNFNGWDVSGSYNLNRWIGLKLDADGHYWSATTRNRIFSVDESIHDVMVGPQFSWRQKRFTLFAHTLFGYSRFHNHFVARDLPPPFPNPESQTTNTNELGVALGGGGDWNLGKNWAWRAQADYLQAAGLFTRSDNFRFSTGIVFRFGSH